MKFAQGDLCGEVRRSEDRTLEDDNIKVVNKSRSQRRGMRKYSQGSRGPKPGSASTDFLAFNTDV